MSCGTRRMRTVVPTKLRIGIHWIDSFEAVDEPRTSRSSPGGPGVAPVSSRPTVTPFPVPPLAYIEEALMRSSPPCAWYFPGLPVTCSWADALAAAPGQYKHGEKGSELDECFRDHARSHLLQGSGIQRVGAPLPDRPSHPDSFPDGTDGGAQMSCQSIRVA